MSFRSWVRIASLLSLVALIVSCSVATDKMAVATRGDTSGSARVLRAEAYVDVVNGRLIRPAVILVLDGRIAAINPDHLPPNAEVIELGEKILLPGLIDAHTHLMISTNDTSELIRQAQTYSESDFLLEAIDNGYATLMAGFTTVRDLDSWYFVDIKLSQRDQDAGISIPRIIPAGHGINVSGPADYSHIFPKVDSLPDVGIADSLEELLQAVDHQADMGARVIKLYGTSGITMSAHSDQPVGGQTYSDELVSAVVARARHHGLKVATHAHGSKGIMASVKAGAASIEHGSMLDEEIIAEMKARGTFLVPTTNIMNESALLDPDLPPKGIAVVKRAIESHKRAIAAGVRIAYGTDAGLYPHGRNADGFRDLVEYGMTPAAVLQTATVHAAELLGVEDRGIIAVGKLADLIAVHGDPLQDIEVLRSVDFVMKGGRVFKP